jgi:stage V sporulation protein D (sporulation-specific penicillin-binding protein)
MNKRVIFVNFLFLVLTLLIIWRLFNLQIVNGEMYQALLEGIRANSNLSFTERGKIFFRSGEELATNITSFFVLVNPKQIKGKKEVIEKLSEILNLEKNYILENLEGKDSFFILKKRLTEEQVNKLKNIKTQGIFIGEEKIRYYPQEKLASEVVGFVNEEGEGQYGIEEYYNDILKEGKDITLTLDYRLQFKVERLLEEAKEKLEIEGGQIIVMNPKNGEILALADFPTFDPNKYREEENLEIFRNGVTQKTFEPGSIFKIITMAAAIEEKKVTPETTYVDEGFVKIGGWTIRNFENRVWGKKNMTEVLMWSINTGAVFAERQLGKELFLKYLTDFGVFEKTGIDLPEVYSENKEFKKGYEINFATASFGQGIEVTPIQVMKAISAVANGGILVRPHLLLENGKNYEERKVISGDTSFTLSQMCQRVVEEGYGKRAKIHGYFIAGKTGTSQIPFSALGIKQKGYSDKTWQSFIGWIPAFKPKFIFLVKLDNPKAKAAGASTTLIAKELIEYLISYYQIPPDYE